MENCIFCKIVKGEVPCYKVYEDDNVLAFLDINPAKEGHALVIPKKHFRDTFDIDKNLLREIISVAKKISIKMKGSLGAEGINFWHSTGSVAGQDVFHFHLHIIPRKSGEKGRFSPFHLSPEIHPGKEEFQNTAKKLKVN